MPKNRAGNRPGRSGRLKGSTTSQQPPKMPARKKKAKAKAKAAPSAAKQAAAARARARAKKAAQMLGGAFDSDASASESEEDEEERQARQQRGTGRSGGRGSIVANRDFVALEDGAEGGGGRMSAAAAAELAALPAEGGRARKAVNRRGVIYIGHLPDGFYEEAMSGFFAQFGDVLNLRVSRSKKTGRPRGYAFVQFESDEVARIVVKTMHKYMLYGKTLVCELLEPARVHAAMWDGANRKFRRVPWRKLAREAHNAEGKTGKALGKQRARRRRNERDRRAKLAALGIDYDFAGYGGAGDAGAGAGSGSGSGAGARGSKRKRSGSGGGAGAGAAAAAAADGGKKGSAKKAKGSGKKKGKKKKKASKA